jgi:hypothetical protein
MSSNRSRNSIVASFACTLKHQRKGFPSMTAVQSSRTCRQAEVEKTVAAADRTPPAGWELAAEADAGTAAVAAAAASLEQMAGSRAAR